MSGADIHRVVTAPEPDSEDVNAVLAMEDQRDGIMAEAAAALLRSEDPTAMFVYFHQADGTDHTVGYGGLGKRHGGGHGNPLVDNSFLIASGPSVAPGRAIDEAAIVDVVPTELRHLGIPPREELDGQPLKLR